MIRRVVPLLAVISLIVVVAIGGTLYWLLAGDGVRLALERQATAWLGQPVRIGSARPAWLPRPGIRLERVEVGDPVALTLGTIDVSSDARALLSRRIENASIEVTNSRIRMPLPFGLPESRDQSTSGGGVKLVSVRSISLHGITLESRRQQIIVSAESSLSGSRLLLRSFTAATARTTLDASGEIDLAPRVDARLRVKANRLDVDELLALASAFAPPKTTTRAPGTADRMPARIAARLSAETASAAGVMVRQFATDLEVVGGRLSLSPLTFQLFGGRYQGSLAASLGETIAATLRSRLMDLDVAQLAEFGGSGGAITGRLTGAGDFSGAGLDMARLLRSIHGDGTVSIVNGTIQHLNLVPTVVLFFGRPAPDRRPASDAFQRLDATVAIANRVVTAQALSLHSTDADIVGTGTLNLDTSRLDGRLDMSLSEALSAQAGRDLYRYTREGNRVVLPATIGGTLGSPRLAIDASAAIQRGLKNEIQRRLGGILDRFRTNP